jgi:hypothetical protein
MFGIFILVFFILFFGTFFVVYSQTKHKKKLSSFPLIGTSIFLFIYVISIFLFGVTYFFNDFRSFYISIVYHESAYTPLAFSHSLTFYTFVFLSIYANFKLWIKGRNQPPLLTVIYTNLVLYGLVLCILLLFQIEHYKDGFLDNEHEYRYELMIAPLLHIIFSVFVLFSLIKNEQILATHRSFKNKTLEKLNSIIAKSTYLSFWIFLFFIPIFILITLILIVFGQEYDSLVKVFTNTTTWYFSQKSHPPYLQNEGHYLCTVAACGSPKVVKPILIGERHGNKIIVNRQLQIANAFEEIIMVKYPKTHQFIRKNYDKYGYPISKDINTESRSNLVYICMKPFEWLFLIFIYLTHLNPEHIIKKQYNSLD